VRAGSSCLDNPGELLSSEAQARALAAHGRPANIGDGIGRDRSYIGGIGVEAAEARKAASSSRGGEPLLLEPAGVEIEPGAIGLERIEGGQLLLIATIGKDRARLCGSPGHESLEVAAVSLLRSRALIGQEPRSSELLERTLPALEL
jgi:hypothetical protein